MITNSNILISSETFPFVSHLKDNVIGVRDQLVDIYLQVHDLFIKYFLQTSAKFIKVNWGVKLTLVKFG